MFTYPLHAILCNAETIPEPHPSSTLCDCSTSSANVLSQSASLVTEMVAGEYMCIYSIDMYVQHGFNITCCYTVEYMTIHEVMYKNGTIKELILCVCMHLHNYG